MTISPGVYLIKNPGTNTVFDQYGPSNKIHAWAQHTTANHQWWFVIPLGNGVVLRNVYYGQYACITSVQNGSKVLPSNNLTIWKLSWDENEWTISFPGTNYVIEVGGGDSANGGIVRACVTQPIIA
ncbi:hypothetical protein OPQ81_005322 [Rhizoctonia solani]|nr:hypothetical protein OPQ81_005322 [Rhizoctonia solani]